MNKKGTVLHWVIFGILVALAVFFVMSKTGIIKQDSKGYWSLHFLKNNYLEAEKILLAQESIERDIAKDTILELAQNGGLQKTELSACGTLQQINLWNTKDHWCPLDPSANFSSHASAQLKQKIPSIAFNNIGYTKNTFHAKAKPQQLRTLLLKQANFPSDQNYFYNPSFAIELSYSFDDYTQVQNEAKLIVEQCRNTQDHLTCIDKTKPTHWHTGFCDNQQQKPTGPATTDRKTIFCVQSPNGYTLPTTTANQLQSLFYTFALDFTPSALLPIQDTTITYLADKNSYQIQFSPNPQAQGYKLYYTNWLIIKDNVPGKPQDIFSTIPQDPALAFYATLDLKITNLLPCTTPTDAQPNQAYLCQNKIHYYLTDPKLKQDISYILGITAYTDKEESQLTNFVDLK